MSFRRLVLPLAAVAALSFAACSGGKDSGIRVEHTPKDEPPPAANTTVAAVNPAVSVPPGLAAAASSTDLPPGHPAVSAPASPMSAAPGMQALPGMAEFTAATPTPQWSTPAAWVAQPPNPVRKATWLVPSTIPNGPTAELSVNVFQGQLGGLLANVNRWRGQVGLDPDLTDATLPTCVTNLSIGGRPAQLVTLDGPAGRSLEGALIFLPDRVWSFRLTGPAATVSAARPAFRAFLDSIRWPD